MSRFFVPNAWKIGVGALVQGSQRRLQGVSIILRLPLGNDN